MKTFYTEAGKPCGELKDGVLRKDIKHAHIMKKWDAIGLDAKMFNELPDETEIRVRVDKGQVYSITKSDAQDIKMTGEFGAFGKQYFIPVKGFKKL